MAGISDIAKAFRDAAPAGVQLREVRMQYDNDVGEQVFEFDITDADGDRTMSHRSTKNTAEMVGHVIATLSGDTLRGGAGDDRLEDVPTNMERAIKQMDESGYDLVKDDEPEPKPTVFF